MKLLINISALAAIFLSVKILFAGGPGTSAGLTLTETISAETAGISESATALSGNINLIASNPASIHSLKGNQIALNYRAGLGGDMFASLLYGRRLPFASLGFAVNYYTTGEITMYDLSGNAVNKTGQRDIVLLLGAARKLNRIPAGVNLKLITSEIFGYTAMAFAMDAGLQYEALFEGVNIGIAARNIGTSLKYINESDPLPLNIITGVSYSKIFTSDILQVSVAVPYYVNEKEFLGKAGFDYRLANLLTFMTGSRINLTRTDSFLESINMGVGISWDIYSLHYSIAIVDNLSNPHNVSIRVDF